jgi:hypothetical protein
MDRQTDMDAPLQLTRSQKFAGSAISAIALLILIVRPIWPGKILLDQGTLVLLALAALPWLTLFFKTISIPGVVDAQTRERSQGATQKPLPPMVEPQPAAAVSALSPNVKKVLATLWRYQRQTFGNDIMKRWTFAVHPCSRDYPPFLSGLSEAVNRGWVAVSPETHQCMLTNEGLAYIEANKELQDYRELYRF